MKKKPIVICLIMSIICIFSVGGKPAYASTDDIFLGGIPAGFTLSTKGAHIVGICDVVTSEGIVSPAKSSGLKVGDIILKIDNNVINNANDIEKCIKSCGEVPIELLRDGQNYLCMIKPCKDINGHYKLGVFVKDTISGIGTITFFKGDKFASLGHAVIDDNSEVLNITSGNLYNCNITGIVKGEKGSAGELKGVFLRTNQIAVIEKNTISGVYGRIDGKFDLSEYSKIEVGEAKIGNATIFSTVNGKKPKKYNISIVKCDYQGDNKNFVIKVTDEELLSQTGGIVQGMSGSPIVQDGKLVGAVTHVFINDPTRGFGISIDNMLKNM